MADDRKIYLTDQDLHRLQGLIDPARPTKEMEALQDELDQAIVVPQEMIPPNVVTMNSVVRFKDLDRGQEMEVTLVYPQSAKIEQGRLSILAPVGVALIGLTVGDTIEWPVPAGGTKRLKILNILYQPEASGDWHL